jgi:hypothetical protein
MEQEVWRGADSIPRIGQTAGMKKRPDGMGCGRNSEYLFRRIYPTQSDSSREKSAHGRR